MKRILRSLKRAAEFLDAPDDPREPAYDPAHLGAVLIVCMVVIGLLYWLLWTLLVYEGGLFSKIGPALQVLLGQKTSADFGYVGSPYEMGAFQGWAGNAAALVLASLAVAGVHRVYWEAARRAAKK